MKSLGKVTADYSPADGICKVLVPGWPEVPCVEARTDGQNTITIEVNRIHEHEAWRLVRMRGGVLCAMAYLTQPSHAGLPQRTTYNAVVKVPPGKIQTIQVLVHKHEQS